MSELLPKYQAKLNTASRGAQYGVLVHSLIENWKRLPVLEKLHEVYTDAENLEMAYGEAGEVVRSYPEILSPDCLMEVELNAKIGDETSIHGRIDALVISDHKIRIIDFKTEIETCDKFHALHDRYKMQLAFYWHHLSVLYPKREISAEIIWTYLGAKITATHDELKGAYQELKTHVKNAHGIDIPS